MLRQTCEQRRQSLREAQTLMTILGLTALAFYVDFSDRYLLEISPAYVKEVGPRWLYMSHQRDCSNLRTGPALLGIHFDPV